MIVLDSHNLQLPPLLWFFVYILRLTSLGNCKHITNFHAFQFTNNFVVDNRN